LGEASPEKENADYTEHMPTFELPATAYVKFGRTGERCIRRSDFETFDPRVLGLGNIQKDAVSRSAICAIFDLEQFTTFCRQIEPHLSVPVFLNEFLNWIFKAIRKETVQRIVGPGKHIVKTWHDLPFFAKFTGDGLMILWDPGNMGATNQHDLITSIHEILKSYQADFFPVMQRKVVDAPPVLRCGIAKGTVLSVGDGSDFVGSCINMAARLQGLHGPTISFARRGFDPETHWKESESKEWLLRKVSIRGIGNNELVYLRRDEFKKLSPAARRQFRDP